MTSMPDSQLLYTLSGVHAFGIGDTWALRWQTEDARRWQWTNLRYAHMGRNGAECMCLYGEWYFRQFTLPLPKASDDLLFPMCLFAASEVCSLFVVSVIEGRQKHCQDNCQTLYYLVTTSSLYFVSCGTCHTLISTCSSISLVLIVVYSFSNLNNKNS